MNLAIQDARTEPPRATGATSRARSCRAVADPCRNVAPRRARCRANTVAILLAGALLAAGLRGPPAAAQDGGPACPIVITITTGADGLRAESMETIWLDNEPLIFDDA